MQNQTNKTEILWKDKKFRHNDEHIDDDVTELNNAFVIPSLNIKCEMFDFVAKTNGGLQTHKRAKHKGMLDQTEIIISETNSETN